jgi:hypothetical protein
LLDQCFVAQRMFRKSTLELFHVRLRVARIPHVCTSWQNGTLVLEVYWKDKFAV